MLLNADSCNLIRKWQCSDLNGFLCVGLSVCVGLGCVTVGILIFWTTSTFSIGPVLASELSFQAIGFGAANMVFSLFLMSVWQMLSGDFELCEI